MIWEVFDARTASDRPGNGCVPFHRTGNFGERTSADTCRRKYKTRINRTSWTQNPGATQSLRGRLASVLDWRIETLQSDSPLLVGRSARVQLSTDNRWSCNRRAPRDTSTCLPGRRSEPDASLSIAKSY